jgi:hypothetical protein
MRGEAVPLEVLAIEAIRQLTARYFRLLDQKRWDDWGEVFTDDVVVDTTDDGVDHVIHGRDEFVAGLRPLLEGVRTVHHGHMPEIQLTGPDTASGVWSMEDHLFWPEDQGGMTLWGTGWYEEEYRRGDDGQWRIAVMKLRRNRIEVNGSQVFPQP